jgi:hypothetical protein
MLVALSVERTIHAAPAAVFELALDPARFPATFRGCGPIPALRRINLTSAPAVGATRAVESSDGSVLTERITAYDPPHRHAYVLTGMRPPLAWLARAGNADWSFANVDNGTQVQWNYAFELTSLFAWPVAFPLLQIFMRAAMRRCLAAMARELEPR